jgi:hypothetical protein
LRRLGEISLSGGASANQVPPEGKANQGVRSENDRGPEDRVIEDSILNPEAGEEEEGHP